MKEIMGFRAFNYLYFIYLFAFAASGGYFAYLFFAEDIFSWLLAITAVIFLLLLLIDDIYYIFTQDEMIFVHFLGSNTKLAWSEIVKITKSSGFDSLKELPHYSLYFNEQNEGVIKQGKFIIPSTRQTKKCIETYYKGEILTQKPKKQSAK